MSGVSLTAIQSKPCWNCDAPGEVAVLKSESSDTEYITEFGVGEITHSSQEVGNVTNIC